MKKKLLVLGSIFLLTFSFVSNAIGQWVQTNGPYGGFVTILATSGTNIFGANAISPFGRLSGTGSGVFVSSDEGKTWVSSNNGLTERKITALVTLGTYVFTGTQDSGVFLTTNNGLSWKSVNHGTYSVTPNNDTLRLQKVRALAITGTTIYAGTDHALFLSKDSGTSWTSVNITSLGLNYNPIQKIAVVDDRIFLATRQDVFVSSDNGANWKYLLRSQNILSFVVNGADIYAAGSDYNGGSGDGYIVWVSIDSGKSWVLSTNGLNSQQNASATSLAVSGTNVYLGTSYDGIFRSTDKGATWVQTYLSYTDVEALAIIGNDLYAGTRYRGVLISNDSATSWKERNNGLPLSNIKSMAKMGGALFAGTDGGKGIYRSTNKGIDWIDVNNGLNDWQNLSLASNGMDLYYGGYTVFHSNDSGNNWTASKQYFAQVYALATFDSMIIASVETPFANFISSDMGNTWNQINSSLGGAFTGAFAQRNKSLFIGTSYGEGTQNQEGVYLSTDNGADWKQMSTVVDNSAIFSLAVIDINLFAGTSHGVFLSTNNGSSWNQTNTGFNMSHVNKVVALAVSGSTIFAGTGDYGNGDGVYMSNNNGKSWDRINQGLLPSDITSLVIIDSTIYAGTLGAGVWRRPLSDFGISDVKNPPQPDLNISLSPNPTTGIITVHNSSANILHVTVSSILGESVLELEHPNAPDFTLDLSKLPLGTYFARFKMATSVAVMKIIKQ